MANIAVHKSGGQTPPAKLIAHQWEPFRLMRDVMGWDPFAEIVPAWPTEARPVAFVPAFEVKETRDVFIIKADVPGINEENLDISLTGNRLLIAGKREAEQEEKGDQFYLYDRCYGSFTRAFTLPDGVDIEHVRADLKGGVLTVILPKRPEVLPKKIGINVDVKPTV